MRTIESKTILSKVANDSWFRLSYNMNLYRGCSHACIYCDSRSECYRVDEFDKPAYKSNAIDLLTKELSAKKKKGIIGFGSMNDPYMPEEEQRKLTRSALEVIQKRRFPVHIITKSDLVLRDIDLLKDIAQTYACVSFTITTMDEKLAAIIEPKAPSPMRRIRAMKLLRESGIHSGITLMPVLPFLNDTEENLQSILNASIDAGCEYIIPYFGVTLRKGSRDYFYAMLDRHFKGLSAKYTEVFGEKYECNSPNASLLYAKTKEWCLTHGLLQQVPEYQSENQLSLPF